VNYINKYPGLYKLYYRKSFHKTPWGEPIVLDTRTEENKVNEPETQPTMYDERSAADRRNDELTIRELMAKNAELLAENKMLKTQIAALEEELVAAEQEAEENATSAMADNTVSVVGQVASMLPAVLDKWFSLQEQKNQMLAEQLRRNRPMQPPVYQNHSTNDYEETGY
jgi:predicted RNase H-like nuclease (RuvC/YqgF family)